MQEKLTTMQDLKPGDAVAGSDGQWHAVLDVTPIATPPDAFRLTMDDGAGSVTCSGDHQWTIWVENEHGASESLPITVNTYTLRKVRLGRIRVGAPDGPRLLSVEKVRPAPCRCAEVDSEDHLFEVLTDEGQPVLTHNCQQRMVAGRLGTTASIMATGSSIATSINGDHKGAGMLVANGSVTRVQYYFETPDWIEKWWAARGMDSKGWAPEDEHAADEANEVLEGEEEVTVPTKSLDIEFMDEHRHVDNSQDQTFMEV